MKRKLLVNTIFSILLQIITVICGFILPRLILEAYGSEVNGLVQSITQFLGLIAFFELGVGAVIQSSLYKPIAEKDNKKIGQIMSSGGKYFSRLALILLVYVIVLICVYPFISASEFGWMYSATLIAAMAISSFAQYYFGVLDSILLNADQKGYIQYSIQIVTVVLNTVICAFLIKCGGSIQLVKLVTSLLFLIRPLFLRIYIRKKYHIDRHEKYETEPLQQKWNGISQHVAAVVLDGTDNVVLTFFSSLSNVSIYSAYHNVVYGVKNLFISTTNGFQSALGDAYAKGDTKTTLELFSNLDFLVHTLTSLLFTCAGLLIIPFISVYTDGITDANYIQPLFAFLIVLAHACHCLRLPYHIAIKAAGHYKQTQRCYIIAAILNIVISIITVFFLGLIGVAIGTLVAMVYQTIWMAIYDSKHIIRWPIKNFIKQCFVDLLTVLSIIGATFWIKLQAVTYLSWFIMACEVGSIALIVTLLISIIFYRKQFISISKSLFGKLLKKNMKAK